MGLRTPLPYDAVLAGQVVDLVPLAESHLPALKEIAFAHVDEYRLTSTPTNEEQAERYFGTAFADREAGRAHPVTVVDKAGAVLGLSRITDVHPRNLGCELGYTWYHPSVFRSAVNTECKLLILGFAFESLGLHRVDIFTDTRNLRSQAAIRALGAVFEGVARRHRVTKDGFVRDSMVYAITDLDWPNSRLILEERLARRLSGSREGSPQAPADL